MKKNLLILLMIGFVLFYWQRPALSQTTDKLVAGIVKNSQEQFLEGVSVTVKGRSDGVATNHLGEFKLSVPNDSSVLVFSYVGYEPLEIYVGQEAFLNVVLSKVANESMDEVIVVGYGKQKKSSVTGAVSTISGADIVTTKNENPQNMLTGKIPGVRVVQKSAEPGAFNNSFDIRGLGSPLVVIDGVPRTVTDFQRLNANDIENLSVLKDASAAIYGVRAANGVVLVTTKKGSNNKSTLSYDGSYTWQIPSGLPKTVDIFQYMTLRNEAAMHNINGGSAVFGEDVFEEYRNGTRSSTDWYPLVFGGYAPQSVHNLSATGGNDKIQYYVGGGYMYQGGFFKTDDLNYNKYSLRSSITAKVTQQVTLDAGVNLISETTNKPYQEAWWIIRSFWRQGPQIPAYANDDPTKPYHGLIEGDNPISFMDKDIVGYRKIVNNWVQPSLSLRYDIPGVKGLNIKTLFSYDYNNSNRTHFQKQYQQYRYDAASDTYESFTRQSPNRVTREAFYRSQLLTQTTLAYSNRFFEHQVDGTLVWEAQKRDGDNFMAQRDLALQLPYLFAGVSTDQIGYMYLGNHENIEDFYNNSNMGMAGRFNYAFANKYLAEFLFRYDGSSKFSEGYRWGFFPGVSVGWRLSEEKFIKNSDGLSFIDQLKMRASYGVTGDDGASTYQWFPGYRYPSSSDSRNFTGGYVFDENFVASANNIGITNPVITWFTAKTLDVGIDFVGWKGLLGFTVDYFNRKRNGLLAQRNGGIPTVVGAGLPQENINSDQASGFDLEITHRNQIGDIYYGLKGILSYTRIKTRYVESGAFGNSYNNWRNNQNNRYQGTWWGWQGNGQFTSWDDIYNSPVYISRNTLPGDYQYEDWNGDGEISSLDVHPLQYGPTNWMGMGYIPLMNYSMLADFSYKGFDLNLLLQGSALTTFQYLEQLYQPLWGSGESGAVVQFMDRWHPSDPQADPYDPSTQWVQGHYAYTGSLPDVNSSFNSVNGAYLRLKSVELGYSLPSKFLNRLGISKLRIYANAYNMLTFSKVKYMDPEHPNDTYGYLYPLNKTVSAGINLVF